MNVDCVNLSYNPQWLSPTLLTTRPFCMNIGILSIKRNFLRIDDADVKRIRRWTLDVSVNEYSNIGDEQLLTYNKKDDPNFAKRIVPMNTLS